VTPERIAFGRQIYDFFTARGLPPHQAAAIAGNMAWEGGGRADLVNPGDNLKNSPNSPHSVGIGQWNDRAPALIAYARSQGLDIPQGDTRDARYMQDVIRRIPLEQQLGFAWNEMQGPERRAFQRLSQGGDLRSAAEGAISYHRPAGWTWGNPAAGHGFSNRVALGQQIMGFRPPAPIDESPGDPTGTVTRTPSLTPPSASPMVASANPGVPASPTLQSAIVDAVFGRGSGAGAQQQQRSGDIPQPGKIPQAPDPRSKVDIKRLLAIVNNRSKLGV
jgi:hypothetical protein